MHEVLGLESDYLDRMSTAKNNGFNTVIDSDYAQYPQDGRVYRVASSARESELGHTSKHPRFAIALKQKEHFSAFI